MDEARFRDAARGALVGGMLGDALGRPLEMTSRNDSRLAARVADVVGRSAPLRYTDDTEMALAVAESIVRVGTLDPRDILAALAEHYDPSRGYGHGMKRALEAFRDGRANAAFASWGEGSRGAGAAARVAAIACLFADDPAALLPAADASASTTHAHPIARAGAVVQALAVAFATRHAGEWSRTSREALVAFLIPARDIDETFAEKLTTLGALVRGEAALDDAACALGNGTTADEAVPLALFCFARWAPDFDAVVTHALLAGGDTDTVAAMAGASCGALVGDSRLPGAWMDRLAGEQRGVDHARSLADDLLSLRSRISAPRGRPRRGSGPGG